MVWSMTFLLPNFRKGVLWHEYASDLWHILLLVLLSYFVIHCCLCSVETLLISFGLNIHLKGSLFIPFSIILFFINLPQASLTNPRPSSFFALFPWNFAQCSSIEPFVSAWWKLIWPSLWFPGLRFSSFLIHDSTLKLLLFPTNGLITNISVPFYTET